MATDTAVLTLTDFVLARIAEDEAVASRATPGPWYADEDYSTVTAAPFTSARAAYDRDYSVEVDCWVIPESMDSGVGHRNLTHIARHDPDRVLAECEAKRRIVERLTSPDPHLYGEPCHDCATLYDLAAVYSDHPDYRDDWRA